MKHLVTRSLNISILLILVFFNSILFSQNEAQKWYFGNKAGLDFSTSPPTILTNGVLNTNEGCSAICNSAGNLLFYTDGITVYNSAHAVMANGTGLTGNSSTTQSAIVIRQPGSGILYYVFTLAAVGGTDGVSYSIVDMSLAAGMGSVTVKNFTLFTPSCEKLTAVRHCNGVDIWVVTHDWNSNNFRAFLVTSSGVNTTPVISSVGTLVTGVVSKTLGQMKISPNGKKLACCYYDIMSVQPIELYDFDPSTGVVSNSFILANYNTNYGCEFSPDGTKFYASGFGQNKIFQWDLCAGTNTAVVASQYTMASTEDLAAMQLGPDGKIYVIRFAQPVLGVIQNPNLAGAACNYNDLGQSVSPKTTILGLPGFINSFFRSAPVPFTYTTSCQTVTFSSPPLQNTVASGCSVATNTVTSIAWSFGDPLSGANNTSSLPDPTHTYPGTGTYTVHLILYYACSSDTIKLSVNIPAITPTLNVNGSFTLCLGEKKTYTVTGATTYTWHNTAQSPTITLSPTGTTVYSVTGSSGSCLSSKFFTVTVNKCTSIEQLTQRDGSLNIYPNPVSGLLTIETTRSIKLLITNSLGKVLSESFFEPGKFTLDISNYESGVYTLKSIGMRGIEIIRLVKTE